MLAAPTAMAPPPDNMPDQSTFGLGTAHNNNGNRQNNGNPEDAPPFQWLQNQADDADQTVDEFCEDVPHPGGGNGPPE